VAESSRINIFFTLLWCSNDSEGHSTSSCLLKKTLRSKRKMDTIHMPYHTCSRYPSLHLTRTEKNNKHNCYCCYTREISSLGKGEKRKTDRKICRRGFFFSFLMVVECWLEEKVVDFKRTFVFSSSRREMTRKWKLLYVTHRGTKYY
jgi:hypothetical protein